jgi:hypothetical protein
LDLNTNADLIGLKARLLGTMHDYMTSFESDGDEAPYSAADIERCAAILDAFVENVGSAAGNADRIMAAVQDAVLRLNDLSEESGSLIETDQREDLCEFIELAARAGGLHIDANDDITEEWREW